MKAEVPHSASWAQAFSFSVLGLHGNHSVVWIAKLQTKCQAKLEKAQDSVSIVGLLPKLKVDAEKYNHVKEIPRSESS